MAEDILVKEPLTREMIDAGQELLRRLDEVGFEVAAAFWLYTSETNRWRLMLAHPGVDVTGAKPAYGTIWDVLYGRPDGIADLESTDTTVLSSSDNLVRAVASVGHMIDISGKRLGPTGLNGVYVDDIYIYFIRDSVEPLPGPRWMSK